MGSPVPSDRLIDILAALGGGAAAGLPGGAPDSFFAL